MKTVFNPNCEADYCNESDGEVRLLPSGGDSNSILCHRCYKAEIIWRQDRNRELAVWARFKLPTWESLKVYKGGE